MPNLPPVGVQLVAQGAAAYQAALSAAEKATQRVVQAVQNAANNSPALAKGFQLAGSAASAMGNLVSGAAGLIVSAIGAIVTVIVGALVGAIGLAVAAISGLAALAVRAGPLGDIEDAFKRITSAAGITADTLTSQLQAASLGTITKFELLKATNEALIGTTQQLGTELGKHLPDLMAIAQRQADATNGHTLEIFNQLVEGVRRGTARMIESAGVLVDVDAANRAYAASVGVSVDQLNDEQKSLALLNQLLINTSGSTTGFGAATSAVFAQMNLDADDLSARIQANITNIGDNIGLALQPALETVLHIVDTAVSGVATFIQNSIPYIAAIAQIISDALAPVLGTVTDFADQLSSPEMAQRFFVGAANTFGSFVAGVEQAATSIIQIVTGIAKAIADLLLGNSPPPVGPLSKMDTGAAAVMQAWVQGFVGGFDIDPISAVAKQVNDAMGSIANASRGQVEARLAALDKAVKPFQDRLTIIKSTFDAVKAAAQPALDAINRQMDTALTALYNGQAGSDATVRALDAQRAAIEGSVEAQQQLVDQAQIQLSLVQAQQAQERALLGIRQQMLGPEPAATPSTTKKKTSTATPAAPKPKEEKKPSGGSPTPSGSSPQLGGGTGGSITNVGTVVGDVIKDVQTGIAKGDLKDAFAQGLGGAPEALGGATDALDAQITRLQSISGTNNSVSKAFDSIKTGIETKIGEIKTSIDDWIGSITDSARQGSIPYAFSHLGENILSALNGVKVDFTTWVDTNIGTPLRTLFNNLLANTGQPGSLMYFFSNLPANIAGALGVAASNFQKTVVDPINQNLIQPIVTAFETLTGGPEIPGSLLNSLSLLPGQITTALISAGSAVITAFSGAVWFLTGTSTDATTLAGTISIALAFFTGFPALIGAALNTVGQQVWDNFVSPVIDMLNHVIDGFNKMKILILEGLSKLASSAATAFAFIPDVSKQLSDASSLLIAAAKLSQIPHIPNTYPGAKVGGFFGPGGVRVHRGEELVTTPAASRLAVFPASVVRALDRIATFQSSVPMVSAGMVNTSSSSTSHDDHSMTNYFSGVDGERGVARRLAMMRAMR